MTIAIKHAFVSLKGDGTDATQVQPSNWNAGHAFTLASGNLVGRLTAGNGNAEEIPISAYMANLLTAPDAVTLSGLLGLFTTGDVKWTFNGTAPTGWLLINQAGPAANTIGSASSGATLRANSDTLALYQMIYANVSDANAPVTGGRSGNSTTDFNAGKPIAIPNMISKSPMGAGVATGYTTRVLGQVYGGESITLGVANLPPYTPSGTVSSVITWGPNFVVAAGGGNVGVGGTASGGSLNQNPFVTSTFSGAAQGGASTPFGIVHPTIALNPMVKL